ncbi:MAG: hypothetical protein NC328_03855 [Muribaculum sp.]|nr:hypothetical protein [Muribaculum sp.]
MLELSAKRTNSFFSINTHSRIHSGISFDFIGGKMTAVRALQAGCTLTAEEPSNRLTLKGDIIIPGHSSSDLPLEKDIRLLSVVPSQMPFLIENKSTLPAVLNYLIGGSAIPFEIRKLIAESGVTAWESYGMTETASHIAVRRVGINDDNPFRLFDGISIEADSRGCMVITMPESATRQITVSTNDLVKIENAREFRILGRIDNVIISGGKKFHSQIIELFLSKFLSFPFYFTAMPDPKWGSVIVMVCKTEKKNESQIKDILAKHLEKWQIPKQIIFIKKFEYTQNGKLIRKLGTDIVS